MKSTLWTCFAALVLLLIGTSTILAADPPALNPFTPKPSAGNADEPPTINPFSPNQTVREDAEPGFIELSDGTVIPGMIYMTRDKRVKVYDETVKRQREIPLRVIKQIECKVLREWIEREWRFKELALNEKYYTGNEYPSRECEHTITLQDDRKITGALSELIYIDPLPTSPGEATSRSTSPPETQKYLLHKRQKGENGEKLQSLSYVKLIKLGDEALAEGQRRAKSNRKPTSPKK